MQSGLILRSLPRFLAKRPNWGSKANGLFEPWNPWSEAHPTKHRRQFEAMNHTKDAHEVLRLEWNKLQLAWQESQTLWKDQAASVFEKRFMSEFNNQIPIFLSELETLNDELKDASRGLG